MSTASRIGPKPERKPPIVGANIVWYLIALCAGTLFLVSLMEPGPKSELGYMDLVKLIEQGAPAKNPKAAIEVREGRRARSNNWSATRTSTI